MLGHVTALFRIKTRERGAGVLFARVHRLRACVDEAVSAQYCQATLVERAEDADALLIPLSCVHGTCVMTHVCEFREGGGDDALFDDDGLGGGDEQFCRLEFEFAEMQDDDRMAARGIRHCERGKWAVNRWIQSSFAL